MSLLDFIPGPPDFRLDFAALDEAFAWVRALRDCPQDPTWHAEGDVWIHTRMVLDWLVESTAWRNLDETARAIVLSAALLHDVAKPSCTRTEEGRITSRGHSRRGAIDARVLLWRMGVDFGLREAICGLVRHHQVPFFLIEDDDPDRLALLVSHHARCDWLALVTEADARGRHCDDLPRLIDNVALFVEHCRELDCLMKPYAFASDHARFLYFRDRSRSRHAPAHDDTRSRVTMMSGLPAAGKSRWVAAQARGQAVISLDAIRAELGVDPSDEQGMVVQEARARAAAFLRAGEPFVWDATNVSEEVRKRAIDLFADYQARVHVVYVEANEPTIHARNGARQHPVPGRVLDRLLTRWTVPCLTEAHDVSCAEAMR
jgi:predicted kinase